MKSQHTNIYQCLKIILNTLSQMISGDFMNTKYGYHIDLITFNVKCPTVYTQANIPVTKQNRERTKGYSSRKK